MPSQGSRPGASYSFICSWTLNTRSACCGHARHGDLQIGPEKILVYRQSAGTVAKRSSLALVANAGLSSGHQPSISS